MSNARALLELAVPLLYKGFEFINFSDKKKFSLDEILDYSLFEQANSAIISEMSEYITESPKLLGQGVSGVAFDIGNNRVLKFFTDSNLLKALYASKARFTDPNFSSSEPEVFEVDQMTINSSMFKKDIDVQQIPELYFSVMEKFNTSAITHNLGKLETVEPREVLKSIAKFVYKIFLSNPSKAYMEAPFNLNKADARNKAAKLRSLDIETIQELTKYLADKYRENAAPVLEKPVQPKDRTSPTFNTDYDKYMELSSRYDSKRDYLKNFNDALLELNIKPNSQWLENYIFSIITRLSTGRTDLHPGNIGYRGTDGNFIFYDDVNPQGLTNFGHATNKLVKLGRKLYFKYGTK